MTACRPEATDPAACRPGTAESPPLALGHALREISYEILPFRSTEDKVLAHVPQSVQLTVTTTEAKGLESTVDLAARLARAGYSVAPHLTARQIRDEAHLSDLVARLSEAGVDGVFVIGGDAPDPLGRFTDAATLLDALADTTHPFRRIGIGGYPEGHATIDDSALLQALVRKSAHATHLITQLCFSAATTVAWARALPAHGVRLPVRVGLPGAVSRDKLLRIAGGLSLGQSARFIAKQRGFLLRFFTPRDYKPDRLVRDLTGAIATPVVPIDGFHLFTFNELEAPRHGGSACSLERWREVTPAADMIDSRASARRLKQVLEAGRTRLRDDKVPIGVATVGETYGLKSSFQNDDVSRRW